LPQFFEEQIGGNDIFGGPNARFFDCAGHDHLCGDGSGARGIDIAGAGMPLCIGAGVAIHHDGLLAALHNYPRDFVVVGRASRRGQLLKISNAPSGAHALHQLSHKCAIEADLEVGIPEALGFEPERQRGDFAVACHHQPNASNRTAKVDALPAGSRFRLHEAAAAPFPWGQRELFDDCLSGVGKSEAAVARVEINATDAYTDRIDTPEFRCGRGRHHVRQPWSTAHAEDGTCLVSRNSSTPCRLSSHPWPLRLYPPFRLCRAGTPLQDSGR
jgi:hypothetical protein